MRTTMKLKILFTIPLLFSGIQVYGADTKNGETRSTPVASSSASPNVQGSANTSQKQNSTASTISKVVGVANMGMGAVKMSEFAASCSGAGATCNYGFLFQGILHFAMGAQSFMQAKNNSGAAYDSALTGLDTSAWNNPFGDPNSGGNVLTDDANKDKDLVGIVNTGKFNEIKKALTTTGIGGVKMDPKTGKITDTKTGKTYDSSQLSNAQAMADAGFAAGDIAAAMEASSKAEKAAMKKLGVDGNSAIASDNSYMEGGSGSSGTMSGNADINMGSGGRGLASAGGVKIPSNQIAGLTKNFNGERIGVSAENIFNMMNRRYKTKEKQNSFFDPSELVKMPQ